MKKLCKLEYASGIRINHVYYNNEICYVVNLSYHMSFNESIKKIIIVEANSDKINNLPNGLEYLNIWNLSMELTNLPTSLIFIYIYNTNGYKITLPFGTILEYEKNDPIKKTNLF